MNTKQNLGPRFPWLCFLSEVNATIYTRGAYFLPFLYYLKSKYSIDPSKIEILINSLIENGFYVCIDFELYFPVPKVPWNDFIRNLPRVNIYSQEWIVNPPLTTGAIVPYLKDTTHEEALLGLSISTSTSLTYLGGTHESGETILETTVREFEEETRSITGQHVLTPPTIADLHGVPYLMKNGVILFFVKFLIDNPALLVKDVILSGNPETAGLFWLSWSQLEILLNRIRDPSLIINKNYYPFYLTNKLRQALL